MFEGVADRVVERIVIESGAKYRRGWVTPGGGDQGIDFIGRIDVGSGFARAKLVVLGQAKCQSLNKATSGRDVARIVARLRRGWLGAYVTTSYYSTNVQREIIEDRFSVVLVHGLQLAEVLDEMMFVKGMTEPQQVIELLEEIDADYESRLSSRAGAAARVILPASAMIVGSGCLPYVLDGSVIHDILLTYDKWFPCKVRGRGLLCF